MEILRGIGVSPGVAIGTVFILGREESMVVERFVPVERVPDEIQRFRDACAGTADDISRIRDATVKKGLADYAVIFDAHLAIINDPRLQREIVSLMNERHYVAEHAVSRVFRAYISKLEQIDEEYMSQRADDLRDLERRIINNLHGIRPVKLENLDTPVVLVSRSLTPSETASLPKGKIIGIATDLGGQASHASILSRAMEIPAVVGLKAITLHVSSGDVVVIDGTRGEVVISPDEKTLQKYRLLKRNFDFQQHIADVYRDRPVRTMDEGDPVDVTVLANVEKAEDIPRAFERGASGIGLFRTEYLLLNRPIWPDEEEQFATYLKALELADGRTLVFRTFDIDADKMPEKQAIYREVNPALGLRGIRMYRVQPHILRTQLRAMLRAAHHWSQMKGGAPCVHMGIMFPMVTSPQEFIWAKVQVGNVRSELERENPYMKIPRKIRIGAMVEVPGLAYCCEYIRAQSDFFSVGTNDLVQYLFAVDRANEKVAELYTPANKAVFSVLKMIRQQVQPDPGKGPTLSICGEMASDRLFVLLLLGLGYRSFSVSMPSVPMIKYVLRKAEHIRCREVVEEMLVSGGDGLDMAPITRYLDQQLAYS